MLCEHSEQRRLLNAVLLRVVQLLLLAILGLQDR